MDEKIIFAIIDHLAFVVLFLGLIISWRDPFARWLLLSYTVIEIIEFLTFSEVYTWKVHFYLFEVFMCFLFMTPIVFRRPMALFCYRNTQQVFFLNVAERTILSRYEVRFLQLLAAAALVNFITWIEVLCYKYWIIDNAFIKLYFRNYFIACVILAQCAAIYALSMYTLTLKPETKKCI
ncbi:hypothetical protein [Pseudoalteromonas luteoviolacea]|uniref:Uncharacterized protein n=1 Tax=Pseudoalteromonas luteoviolacea H33 TaxID=1365251 RepID=A0A167EHU6_9GAMM|nr:hypothetical protein [Pseudoalteromonas luteoviolacea]KZN50765.1 hypothetical protein N476_15875 [Pseudoalteromonas luteoviolacea H33]KZN77709.1 hypothetical protein N477_12120 [Pseudoalteromonas luteoviolacea H33-S]MBQ4877656.1 hypothetical protein [Pseudoalteromonas luteoviolacea]MBQ4906691.1 hypothetical protein [Pseudoalteromonas luteoviolacea]